MHVHLPAAAAQCIRPLLLLLLRLPGVTALMTKRRRQRRPRHRPRHRPRPRRRQMMQDHDTTKSSAPLRPLRHQKVSHVPLPTPVSAANCMIKPLLLRLLRLLWPGVTTLMTQRRLRRRRRHRHRGCLEVVVTVWRGDASRAAGRQRLQESSQAALIPRRLGVSRSQLQRILLAIQHLCSVQDS